MAKQRAPREFDELRRKAEKLLAEKGEKVSRIPLRDDVQDLSHELSVYHIELEMQNDELRKAQGQLGESLAKYSDLYDFAPVGYVTLNREGLILEANLTFAAQLGIERGRLIDTPLWLYAAAPDRGMLRAHLDRVFKSNEQGTCELRLQRPSGPELYVQLDSIMVLTVDGAELCRTSVTDICNAYVACNTSSTQIHDLR